jgi:hypothetical protein
MPKQKRITLATVKAFIRRNDSLHIRIDSEFDGMVDGVRQIRNPQFRPVLRAGVDLNKRYTLGIPGAWFVGQSRDYFSPYSDGDGYIGYEISNACASFVLARKRAN